MDRLQKFSGKASEYLEGRPAYAEEMIEYFYQEAGFSENSVIADIGSGTGKLAGQLVKAGSCVIGVEPNADMRQAAEKILAGEKHFVSVNGTADNTGLKDQSVDLITTAQAFHWFPVREFQEECRRILKPGGKVFLIWNMRDPDDDVNRISYDIFRRYCPEFRGFGGGIKKHDERIVRFFEGRYRRLTFDNPLYFDYKKFISRSLSGSYSLIEGDPGYEEYIRELDALFRTHSAEGILKMPNRTVVYEGIVKDQ